MIQVFLDTFESKLKKEFQEATPTNKITQNSDTKNSDFETVNSEGDNKHGDTEVEHNENLNGVQNNDHLFQAYIDVEDGSKRSYRQKRNVKVSLSKLILESFFD